MSGPDATRFSQSQSRSDTAFLRTKSSAQEGSSRLLKVRPFFTEDGPVACVREDPELRLRYGLRHFDGELDGIERITVALHDEVHVVVTRGKRSRAFKDSPNLRIPTRMTTAKKFPLFLREAVGILAHDGTRRCWKVRSGADQHHRFDAFRLPGGQVQEDVTAAAHSDSFASADFQVVEEREHVCRGVLMAKWLRQDAGAAVSPQVGQDELEVWTPGGSRRKPVLARARETVKQQKRLTGPVDLEVDSDAV